MATRKTSKQTENILRIGRHKILPGERKKILLEVAALFDYTPLTVPIEVIRGTREGPSLFVSAAIHGDELNGVEIVKRLLQTPFMSKIKGTLITVPVVNVFGYNNKSRYLPDRRDLNRSFPGSRSGSLASRLASIFMKEVVNKCSYGIDLHTGSVFKNNLPQIRACLDDQETEALAKEFGVPVLIHSKLRDGSLREAARKKKVNTLLYEAGEALRFDEAAINSGVKGCISIMRFINMLPKARRSKNTKERPVFIAKHTYWVRASHSGSLSTLRNIGDHVEDNEVLAVVTDPFGCEPFEIKASDGGIIIGQSTIPLANKGDALFHIASFKNPKRVRKAIELLDDDAL